MKLPYWVYVYIYIYISNNKVFPNLVSHFQFLNSYAVGSFSYNFGRAGVPLSTMILGGSLYTGASVAVRAIYLSYHNVCVYIYMVYGGYIHRVYRVYRVYRV